MSFIFSQDLYPNLFNVIDQAKGRENDLFYLMDLKDICKKHLNWKRKLPRVHPHYAVKCSDDPFLVRLIGSLGASFDAASMNEIKLVLDLGFKPERIIYANPCKQTSYIKYAKSANIEYTTFDSETELIKLKELYPEVKCVLRIAGDDTYAFCKMACKFGADMETARELIQKAVDMNMTVVGISFHVGSNQHESHGFCKGIKDARELFDYVREKFNLEFYILDLGGGFPGADDYEPYFDTISREINKSLDQYFPAEYFEKINKKNPLRIIAEPGRYYMSSAGILCSSIIHKTSRRNNQSQNQTLENDVEIDESKTMMYYLNEGTWASFNVLIFDNAKCLPILPPKYMNKCLKKYRSSLWGPTCDGADVLDKNACLPELELGEILAFKNMGAYTTSCSVAFNAMPLPRMVYVVPFEFEDKGDFKSTSDLILQKMIEFEKNMK